MGLTINSPKDWADSFLAKIGAPVTPTNEKAVVAWEAKEGGHWNNTAAFNPLNTTFREPGSTSINSVGVQRYSSWDEGLDAIVKTLGIDSSPTTAPGNQAHGYSKFIADLRVSAPIDTTITDIGDSAWVSGHLGNPAYKASLAGLAGSSYAPTKAKSTGAQTAGFNPLNPLGILPDGTPNPLDLLPDPTDVFPDLTGPVKGLAEFVGSYAIRATLVVFGAFAVLAGIIILFHEGDNPMAPPPSSGSEPVHRRAARAIGDAAEAT